MKMASFTSRAFRTILEPVLKKHGIDLPPVQGSTSSSLFAQAANMLGKKTANKNHKGNDMGALLRFLLINAVSVIGAKLVSEASDRISQKLFNGNKATSLQDDPDHPDAPTLETRVCPKCGAFRIRGETCACGAR